MHHSPATYTDEQLTDLLRQRSQQAFSYLYDNYSGALYTLVLQIIKDRDAASDIIQEVFVKIWKQIDSYDASKGRLFTWMLRIARNTAIDMLRSKPFRNQSKTLELDDNVYSSAGTTEQRLEDSGLRKMMQSLKPEQKAIVELSYFQGYTHEEISKLLDIPVGTVKTRLRAALIFLKKVIS